MELALAIIKLLKSVGFNVVWSLTGKVVSIDEDKRTCEVELTNGDANLTDVRFQATEGGETGVVFIPKKDSNVIVHFLDDDEAYITKTSEVSRVEIITEDGEVLLNGDEFGGLIKIEELTSKINSLVSDFNSFVGKYNSHIHVTTATVMATSLVGVISATTGTASPTSVFSKSDYENETVKHG